ncbi:MAG TPA: glycosyltransferase family 4 protein [Thermohalobaculum sp.]|nr:glycosyltransferase family 4 protein [Thermohalobaculum sp.]
MTQIAFYAPMKPPDHAVPSGDRLIARLTLEALGRAGYAPETVSRLRTIDTEGSEAAQARLEREAGEEAARLIARLRARPPAAWFTYHCHYKAPDLLGPAVAAALGLPYLVSEPSTSPRRRTGAWARFARASDAALAAADRLLWTTARDRPALEAAGWGRKLVALPPFLDPGPRVPPRSAAGRRLGLLTVAMMRHGDKLESYRRLAAALAVLEGEWRLTVIGDGPARAEVEALFAPLRARVAFGGASDDPAALRGIMEGADLFVWPGVGEGVGMAWLEAQAAGLPVVAEDGPAARETAAAGLLAPPGDPAAMAAAIRRGAAERETLSAEARAAIEARHSLDAAAETLGRTIREVTG